MNSPPHTDKLVLGVDYGTDSVRAVLVQAADGKMVGQGVFNYPRWRDGLYCDAQKNQFRQHPQDYLDGLESSIHDALQGHSDNVRRKIVGIGIDTTGSTPVAVTRSGTPLALTEAFSDNPNAMFILWKDHTAIEEAREINEACQDPDGIDYTKYCGGTYSSEWFWAKILHTLRKDLQVAEAAYSWVEHCDWIPFCLTGGTDVMEMKRSRCAAGHKAMWHPEWDGLPPKAFFQKLDPRLGDLTDRLYKNTFTSDQIAGHLSAEWAHRLGLNGDVVVAVGAFDAHMGAVGGQIEPFHLSKVMGTSTCDMLVAPREDGQEKLVGGICGQVDGSILPGMLGLEAGQSAFGDVYAWFNQLLLWPVKQLAAEEAISPEMLDQISDKLIGMLTEAADKIPAAQSTVLALDWLNGRRTPDADQSLKGAIMGLNLGTNAPLIFRALVEATCFGAKAIVDRFHQEGMPVKGLIGLGGVAKKSAFVMQIMADIMNMPIKIAKSEQTCALGAAMFAATAAGIFPRVEEAMRQMGAGFDQTYHPDPDAVAIYRAKYQLYQQLGKHIQTMTASASL